MIPSDLAAKFGMTNEEIMEAIVRVALPMNKAINDAKDRITEQGVEDMRPAVVELLLAAVFAGTMMSSWSIACTMQGLNPNDEEAFLNFMKGTWKASEGNLRRASVEHAMKQMAEGTKQ